MVAGLEKKDLISNEEMDTLATENRSNNYGTTSSSSNNPEATTKFNESKV